jgi:hypothetical protein
MKSLWNKSVEIKIFTKYNTIYKIFYW